MTDQTHVFQLERLYVTLTPGQEGQPPSLQVTGRTPGVRPEQLSECWRLAQLLPPPAAQRTDDMPGSFGIFRGESVDFIIAKAHVTPAGLPQIQYLLLPSAVIRSIAGNWSFFEAFAKEPIPQYTTPRTDLPPFVIDSPEPLDKDAQTDSLLELMNYCKNDLKVVGGLLAGLVEAMGLAIVNAPTSIHDRLGFIQGLLTLLPIPARVAITFATSVLDPAQTNTQIKFLATDVRPERHLVYDWAAGKLLNDAPEDVYAKYIMAQLRLDTSLVLEQTEKLARTSVWRAMRKDDMANALAWVSRRASLDSAVLDGQPADRSMVAAVLREDPTLPDDLRLAYTKHLLNFSLALDDPSETDIVPTMVNTNQALSDAVTAQLKAAIDTDRVGAVYNLLSRWLVQPPVGIDTSRWQPLLSAAAVAQTQRILLSDTATLVKYLEKYLNVPPDLQLDQTIMRIIAVSRKRAQDNADLARVLTLLSMRYLPYTAVQRIFSEAPLLAQLPPPLKSIFPHLTERRVLTAPVAALVRASEVYGEEHAPLLLLRFVEWVLYLQRYDLIDIDTMKALIKAAATPTGKLFDPIIQHFLEVFAAPALLKTLDPKMPPYVVQLSIVSGRYAEAVRQLEVFQYMLYKGTAMEDMSAITRNIYRELPLPPAALAQSLDAMHDSQIKTVARAYGYIGVLESRNWGREAEFAARKLTAIIFADHRITELITPENALRLLKTNAERKDAVETLRLAGSLVEYALTIGVEKGLGIMQQLYPMMTWSPEVNEAAMEILRHYVRLAPKEYADKLPDLLGTRYGEDTRRALDAAYRVRQMLGGANLMNFAEQVQVAAQLLMDMGLTYAPNREQPPIYKLRRTVEAMPGGLTDAERDRLSWNLNNIGQQLGKLYSIAKGRKGRIDNETLRGQLLKNQLAPTTGIDALTWFGGKFTGGTPFTLVLEREAPAYLFGNRSVNILLRETDLIVQLLDGLLNAFPEKEPAPVDAQTWIKEVDTVWGLLNLFKQRQIQQTLMEETQLLAQLITVLGSKSSERIFQPSGYGKQLQSGRSQPSSVIEALRWTSGWFGHMHG